MLGYITTKISPSNLPNPDVNNSLSTLLSVALATLGALSILFITISGLRYILSDGDPQKMSKAKDALIYSLVGLAIAIAAESIVVFVVGRV